MSEAPIFVDTNVLVYNRDDSEPEKQPQAAVWMAWLWEQRSGRLSRQVLHEYYVTVTQKLEPGLSTESARADVRELETWRPLESSPGLVETAWSLQDRLSISYWDALIVGAALKSDCGYLLSEDLQTGLQIDGLRVISPFETSPEALRTQE